MCFKNARLTAVQGYNSPDVLDLAAAMVASGGDPKWIFDAVYTGGIPVSPPLAMADPFRFIATKTDVDERMGKEDDRKVDDVIDTKNDEERDIPEGEGGSPLYGR